MKAHGEEFLIRVSWSRTPDHKIMRGMVTADVGLPPPDLPLTDAEMQDVTFAAKMAVLKALRLRKRRTKPSKKVTG